MSGLLHKELRDIDPNNATPEQMEKLLNDPLIRSLQYQIQHGVKDIKLETNQGETKFNNLIVPDGVDPQEHIQKVMSENLRNEQRVKKEEARKKEAARQERLKTSDPWEVVVSGAGRQEVNGVYERVADRRQHGARVFKGPSGFDLTYESVSGGAGWILGKVPDAYYANQTKDKVPPDGNWMVQEQGVEPAPTLAIVEPLAAVTRRKDAGNAAFKAGGADGLSEAVRCYTDALAIAEACEGAHGVDDDVYGKLYGNRAEAHLQLSHFAEALADAGRAIEHDPCFIKAYVRKAKAACGLGDVDAAQRALADALDVSPGSKEVRALQDEYAVVRLAKSGTDTVLTELDGLTTRLGALLRRKGTAARWSRSSSSCRACSPRSRRSRTWATSATSSTSPRPTPRRKSTSACRRTTSPSSRRWCGRCRSRRSSRAACSRRSRRRSPAARPTSSPSTSMSRSSSHSSAPSRACPLRS